MSPHIFHLQLQVNSRILETITNLPLLVRDLAESRDMFSSIFSEFQAKKGNSFVKSAVGRCFMVFLDCDSKVPCKGH